MKKIAIFILCLFPMIELYAQLSGQLTGSWQGILQVGKGLRMVFHFSKNATDQWSASFDSPDQYATGIACSDVHVEGDSLHLQIPAAKGSFRGLFLTDSTIRGEWKQMARYDLSLKKTANPPEIARKRQTPVPPFPYIAEDLEYTSVRTGLRYGATLTLPDGDGPFPAVVLITGSGAQDRDESIFGHKPFAVLADFLTRHGLIVLRVDDRGVGKSTGNFSTSTSADFAEDVNASLDFLKMQPKANKSKLGLIGHSEGGMIAPMVAVQRKDIEFIVLLAGPGEKIPKLLAEQNAALLKSAGINKDAVQSFETFYPSLMQSITVSKSVGEAKRQINQALDQWKKSTPKNYVLATTGIYNDSSQKSYVENLTAVMYTPWFLYFLNYDPAPNLEKLKCKVLALNGEKDVQVIASSNLAGIQQALEKHGQAKFTVSEIPQLNHLFQTCNKCTLQEYAELEETFSPLALSIISDWIEKNIR